MCLIFVLVKQMKRTRIEWRGVQISKAREKISLDNSHCSMNRRIWRRTSVFSVGGVLFYKWNNMCSKCQKWFDKRGSDSICLVGIWHVFLSIFISLSLFCLISRSILYLLIGETLTFEERVQLNQTTHAVILWYLLLRLQFSFLHWFSSFFLFFFFFFFYVITPIVRPTHSHVLAVNRRTE